MRKTEVRKQKAENRKQKTENRRRSLVAVLCMTYCLLTAAFCFLPSAYIHSVSASDPGSGDWPMWGGTADRNMVSNQKGMPSTWDVKTKKNVKWVAQLGSQ